MEQELLRIFDNERRPIGIATREDVHRLGLWHETFHCWFISKKADNYYIYLQLRSAEKKDYPQLLDITAAGHILSRETVQDGVREVKEELGVEVEFEKLTPVGVIPYRVSKGDFKDYELANVFIYEVEHSFKPYSLQKEEVSGIFRIEFEMFKKFLFTPLKVVEVEGFHYQDGIKKIIRSKAGMNSFVPHELVYFQQVIEKIETYIHEKEVGKDV